MCRAFPSPHCRVQQILVLAIIIVNVVGGGGGGHSYQYSNKHDNDCS